MLDWLDQKAGMQFLIILFVIRWVVIIPIVVIQMFAYSNANNMTASISNVPNINPFGLFVLIVVVTPFIETLVECSLPYFVMSRLSRTKIMPPRPWGFIIVSAILMCLFHRMLAVIIPSFITGVFLAYCYNHFAHENKGKAILVTTAFHGAINIVGWSMVVFENML